MNYWYLVFEEPGGTWLYITAAGGGRQVTVQVSHPILNETFSLVVLEQCPGLLLETTRMTIRMRFPKQYKVVRT